MLPRPLLTNLTHMHPRRRAAALKRAHTLATCSDSAIGVPMTTGGPENSTPGRGGREPLSASYSARIAAWSASRRASSAAEGLPGAGSGGGASESRDLAERRAGSGAVASSRDRPTLGAEV